MCGVFLGVETSRFEGSSDPLILPSEPLPWINYMWGGFGNGSVLTMAGCCGSPILNEHGELLGFFRFMDSTGLGKGCDAEILEISAMN